MDPQFHELATTITRDVTQAVKTEVAEAVKRELTDVLSRDVSEIVKRDVTEALKDHVTDVVTEAEHRIADNARINVEAVREEARLAAEGCAATVQSIERRLDRIESRLDTTFTHYDAVLKNHNERIATLEQKPG